MGDSYSSGTGFFRTSSITRAAIVSRTIRPSWVAKGAGKAQFVCLPTRACSVVAGSSSQSQQQQRGRLNDNMVDGMNGRMSSAVATVKSRFPSVDIEVAEVLNYLIKRKGDGGWWSWCGCVALGKK